MTGRVAPALAGELCAVGRPLGRLARRGGPGRGGQRRRHERSGRGGRRDRGRRRGKEMTGPTRMAGWGRAADGSTVTWTVAEGSKGRRWREVVALGGRDRPGAAARDRSRSPVQPSRARPRRRAVDVPPRAGRDAPRQPRAARTMAPSSTSGAGRSVRDDALRRRGLADRARRARLGARHRASPPAPRRRSARSSSAPTASSGARRRSGSSACRRRAGGSATRPRWTSIRTGCRSSTAGRGSRSSSLDRRSVDGLWTTGPNGARFASNSWISP